MVLMRMPKRAEIARDRQGHADDRRLARGIGGLAHLPVLRRDRAGADDRAALAIDRIERRRAGGKARDRGESADRVEREHPGEFGGREHA